MPQGPSDSSRPPQRRYYRPSHRQRQHDEAHREPSAPAPMLDHPRVPANDPELLTSQQALRSLVDELRALGSFAYDTEFIGEHHFYPRTCVIQVATTDRIVLIDALAELDLAPFWELLADASVQKLVHAGRQDFEPVLRRMGQPPRYVFDTQVVAAFVALPYPASLTKLISELAGVEVSPGAKFTQWDRRPLTEVQLRYAANDVRYLPLLKERLTERLDALGNRAWAEQELKSLEDPALYRSDPLAQKLRVRGVASLGRRKTAVLDALRRWRARTAEAEDVPARVLMNDEVLMSLTLGQPQTIEQLNQIKGLPRPVKEDFGDQILAVIEAGLNGPPAPRRVVLPRLTEEQEQRVEQLWQAIHARCEAKSIAPSMALAKRDLVTWVRATTPGTKAPGTNSGGAGPKDSPLLQGWRGELMGPVLL